MKTVNLELAKQLKEAGYPQESTFYFCEDMGERTYSKDCKPYENRNCGEHPATPTADEILDQLPAWLYVEEDEGKPYLMISKHADEDLQGETYKVYYESAYDEYSIENPYSESLADAAAKMWLYLKKEELIWLVAQLRMYEGIYENCTNVYGNRNM